MIGKFFLRQEPYGMGTAMFFVQPENAHGVIAVAQPVEIKCVTREEREIARRDEAVPPMMRFEPEDPALQSLMDALWQEGYRPKDIGTAGHLAATQAHLKDMRKLVSWLMAQDLEMAKTYSGPLKEPRPGQRIEEEQ